MPSKLDQLRAMTVVVADTGDLDAVRRLKPQDCTTNPTLLLKAVENPAYAHLVEEALNWGRGSGRLVGGDHRRDLRPACGGVRRGTGRDRARAGFDRGRCGSLVRHRRDTGEGPLDHPGLRGTRHRPRSHPHQDRLDLGGHPRGGNSSEGRHRLQSHAPVLSGPGPGLRRSRRVSDLALRRPHSRLAREGRRRSLYGRDRSGRRVGAQHLRGL